MSVWLFLPESVRDATLALLASSGTKRQRHEGVVYWAGLEVGASSVALEAIAPEADTGPGFFRTSVGSNADAIHEVCRWGLVLVAQVHSHPKGWSEHSQGDDEMALKPYPGMISVVVPDYGRGSKDPRDWGGYRWEGQAFQQPDPAGSTPIVVVPTAASLRLPRTRSGWMRRRRGPR
jgi:hypothetical protein